jgi:hypothetical protein
MGTGLSRGVKTGWDVTLTSHPLLVPWSRNGRAIPPLPLWAVRPVQSLSACTRVYLYILTINPTPFMRRDGEKIKHAIKKGNVYLSSLMMKVPDRVYVLG